MISNVLSVVLFIFMSFRSYTTKMSGTLRTGNRMSKDTKVVITVLVLTNKVISVTAEGSLNGNKGVTLVMLFKLTTVVKFTNCKDFSSLTV